MAMDDRAALEGAALPSVPDALVNMLTSGRALAKAEEDKALGEDGYSSPEPDYAQSRERSPSRDFRRTQQATQTMCQIMLSITKCGPIINIIRVETSTLQCKHALLTRLAVWDDSNERGKKM